jgi:hypothetical protein
MCNASMARSGRRGVRSIRKAQLAELPRISLPRRSLHKGKKKDRAQSRSFTKQASSECDSHRPGLRGMDFAESEGKGLRPLLREDCNLP